MALAECGNPRLGYSRRLDHRAGLKESMSKGCITLRCCWLDQTAGMILAQDNSVTAPAAVLHAGGQDRLIYYSVHNPQHALETVGAGVVGSSGGDRAKGRACAEFRATGAVWSWLLGR